MVESVIILFPCSLVSESDHLIPRTLEGGGELERVKLVKILESLYGNHEIGGQGRSENEKLIKR